MAAAPSTTPARKPSTLDRTIFGTLDAAARSARRSETHRRGVASAYPIGPGWKAVMTPMTRLRVQTVALVLLAAWNIVEPIVTHSHAHSLVMICSAVAFGVLAVNNWVIIRREQEREKRSRWD
jgi:hypothetical protein